MDAALVSRSVRDQLLDDRRNLLDLGTRNRLINVPRRAKGVRTVEFVDEKSSEIYRLLVEGKGFTFLPGRQLTAEERALLEDDDTETGGIPQPGETQELDERGVAKRHSDTRLQTRLTSEGLQKRLFDIWYDARTLEEEQGVNILYLALGLLRWYESDSSDVERNAPLVLLPVKLDRTSAADRFTLRWRSEPASPNLSLQAKMNTEFGLKIEDFGEEEGFDLPDYFSRVAETISSKSRWQVLPDSMILGFFSFAKFLMYRDLDPDNWPAASPLDEHPVIVGLLREGFQSVEPIVPDHGQIDPVITPARMKHVVDADASQAVVIEEVVRRNHLVVKGPPGTGKSQTITNIIAAAAAEGLKVLFVAEKMAALDVVHRRLRDVGLGPLTLELHSNKANKRVVLEELKRTKELPARPLPSDLTILDRLTESRDSLNEHARTMHVPHHPSELSPYRVLGNLLRLKETASLPDLTLDQPESWTRTDFSGRRDVCAELVQRLATIGEPIRHPWFGVRCEPLDPSEIKRLEQSIARLSDDLALLRQIAGELCGLLGIEAVLRLSDFDALLDILQSICEMPACDRRALANRIWEEGSDKAEAAVRIASRAAELTERVNEVFAESAWASSLSEARTVIAARGGSIFRLFSGLYRSQLALLKSYLKVPLPRSLSERLALLDTLLAAQESRRELKDASAIGQAAFGSSWRAELSNWSELRAILDWLRTSGTALPTPVFAAVAALPNLEKLQQAHDKLNMLLPRFGQELTELVLLLDLDIGASLGADRLGDVGAEYLQTTLHGWAESTESVTKWIAFYDRIQAASRLGLASIANTVLDGTLSSTGIVPAFERAYYEALRVEMFSKETYLRRFDGELHDRLVQNFRALDIARITLARIEIAASHSERIPRSGGGIGPLGILNGEIAKKRNHLPIRQLLDRAGPVIQELKPIFMMSPLSVAQFLKPGSITFDLLVIDEASQIEPVDALGAVARCRQVVVVGDQRQLPPTRFFAKLTSDVEERDEDDEATFRAGDAESILDLCLAKGMSDRMLNWHYRSKHHSLIAVSNREFYDNRLFIVPSPYDAVAGMGLKFRYLPNAHYDRGNTRTNPVEAHAVAEAVIAHAREQADKSLGVATFSVAQRQAILKELELLRRTHPETEDFFNRASTEPFFVKNLENIQGDERDVIFISVGYGRTSSGYMAMSFGPLNAEGGERRLNVLISRAKLRCEVFSSIVGDDIDLERVRSKGVTAFKLFLSFAQTGRLGVAESLGRDPDSPFEEHVAEKLRARGHDVKTQIGAAGFFVDLAVSDPEKPGRFVLGIECDGAQYHSSRSARDRDRLRQRVLEEHGWIIHRIWSTDWYLRPNEELAKVERAIVAAKEEWRSRDDGLTKSFQAVPLHFTSESDGDVDVLTAHVTPEERPISIPYVEANISVRREVEPHLAPLAEMARYVAQIVSCEGPVHENEIVARIRSAWGLARAGNRIRDAVLAALTAARQVNTIEGGPFYSIPGQQVIVRSRTTVSSLTLRKPEHLPPAEIEEALLALIDSNFGAARDQLVTAVSRELGFMSTSAQLREIISSKIDRMLLQGQLAENGNAVVRSNSS